MLQDSQSDKLYKFEMKDRLIKDKEFDGWKEIPVMMENPDNDPKASLPGSYLPVSYLPVSYLPGPYLPGSYLVFILRT